MKCEYCRKSFDESQFKDCCPNCGYAYKKKTSVIDTPPTAPDTNNSNEFPTTDTQINTTQQARNSSANTLGIIGLIFAFFMPLVTFICSGLGLSKANRDPAKEGKVLNITALCIAAAMYLINIIILVL